MNEIFLWLILRLCFRALKSINHDYLKLPLLQRQGQDHLAGEAGGRPAAVDQSAEPHHQEAAGGECGQV